jgi:hypothetical protein
MTQASQRLFEDYNRRAELGGSPHRADPSLAFKAAELREALSVWRSAADRRAIPCRSDLTPKLMKRFLSQILIVDVVQSEKGRRFRIRVCGTAVESALGPMPKGFLDESLSEPFQTRWQGAFDLALRALRPVRISGRVEYHDRTYLDAEIFLGAMGIFPNAPSSVLVVLHFESNVPEEGLLSSGAVVKDVLVL